MKEHVSPSYSIQQVAEMTGLSKQLIRKWEDRYGIVTPKRLDNGYRVYTNEEVSLLTRVLQLTKEGYSIKQAAEAVKESKEAPILQEAKNDVHQTYI